MVRGRYRRRRAQRGASSVLLAAGVLLTVPAAGTILTGDTALGSVAPVAVTGLTAQPAATGLQTSRPTESGTPSRIVIGAIDVAADVEQVGLAADGTLALPTDPAKVGWFAGSSRPGDAGPAVMVGHLDSADSAAVFARIYQLEVGDDVTVQSRGGPTRTFSITKVTWHAKESFPSEAVYGPTPDTQLRLITCGGRYDRDSGYSDNVVVFATAAAE